MAKRWNLCYPVNYKKDGQDKTAWNRCGVMFENRAGTGFNILLNAVPVPPVDSQDGQIKIMAFEPNDDNRSEKPRNQQQNGQGDLDDEIQGVQKILELQEYGLFLII